MRRGRGIVGDRFSSGGDLAFDVFKRIAPVDVKIGMTECPRVFSKLGVVGVLDLKRMLALLSGFSGRPERDEPP